MTVGRALRDSRRRREPPVGTTWRNRRPGCSRTPAAGSERLPTKPRASRPSAAARAARRQPCRRSDGLRRRLRRQLARGGPRERTRARRKRARTSCRFDSSGQHFARNPPSLPRAGTQHHHRCRRHACRPGHGRLPGQESRGSARTRRGPTPLRAVRSPATCTVTGRSGSAFCASCGMSGSAPSGRGREPSAAGVGISRWSAWSGGAVRPRRRHGEVPPAVGGQPSRKPRRSTSSGGFREEATHLLEDAAEPPVAGVALVDRVPPQRLDERRDRERARQCSDAGGGGEPGGETLLDEREAAPRAGRLLKIVAWGAGRVAQRGPTGCPELRPQWVLPRATHEGVTRPLRRRDASPPSS
jgi:hypothetical protein